MRAALDDEGPIRLEKWEKSVRACKKDTADASEGFKGSRMPKIHDQEHVKHFVVLRIIAGR